MRQREIQLPHHHSVVIAETRHVSRIIGSPMELVASEIQGEGKGKGKNKGGKGDLKGKGKGHVSEMLNLLGSPLVQLQDSWSCALSSPSTKIAEADSWAQVKTRNHGHGKSSQLESQTAKIRQLLKALPGRRKENKSHCSQRQ